MKNKLWEKVFFVLQVLQLKTKRERKLSKFKSNRPVKLYPHSNLPHWQYFRTHISKSTSIAHRSPLLHINALLVKLNYSSLNISCCFISSRFMYVFKFYNTLPLFILLPLVFSVHGSLSPGIFRCPLSTQLTFLTPLFSSLSPLSQGLVWFNIML